MGRMNRKPLQAGIIDIGSHSVRLDIFEVSPNGENRLLETLSRPINLGFDVFRAGKVSVQNISLLSDILVDFSRKLEEYSVKWSRVIATSAIREAFNRELVISRIKNDSGVDIEVLEAQEEAKITFLALREELKEHCDFDSMDGIVFIAGSGSLFVIYFEQGLLKLCEAVGLGTIRAYDEFGSVGLDPDKFVEMLEATAIKKRICEAMGNEKHPLTLIGVGASIRLIVGDTNDKNINYNVHELTPKEILSLANKARKIDPSQLIQKQNISDYLAQSVPPSGGLIRYFIDSFKFSKFICPETTTRSALMLDLIREDKHPDSDPFIVDMISAANYLSSKYGVSQEHARRVADISLLLYDKLKRYYSFAPHSRIILEIASILHDVGRFIDTRQHHKHSYYIISNSQMPGVEPEQQRIVAMTARYHRKATPKSAHIEYMALSAEDKVTVLKLASILRLADAIESAHIGPAKEIKLSIRGEELRIFITTSSSGKFKRLYRADKGDLFSEVYGLKLYFGEALAKL